MIAVHNLTVAFGSRTLFSGATFNMNPGQRYGIVGANGSGKSTFLKILAGDDQPTNGSISIPKNMRLGVLRQDHFHLDDVPIVHVVMMGIPELWAAMEEKEALLARAAEDPESFDVERFGELEEIVMDFDGYGLEARASEILEGLNIPSKVHHEPLSVLSGGFKLRVLLAQTLAAEPDILLLDEPTNHLDIVSIAWLEQFLLTFAGCVAIVSHDHMFLDGVCTHIVDVDYELLTVYTGGFEAFQHAKQEHRDRKEHEIAKQEAEIAGHKKFIDRFKAKASKARQAQSKLKRIEKIEIVTLAVSSRRYPYFKFKAKTPTGKVALEVENVSKAFDDKQVLKDVSFVLNREERVAVIGPNGIGKSTLLKILMEEIEADAGVSEWGHAATPGYYSQDQSEVRDFPEQNVMEWLWGHCTTQGNGFVRGKLAEVLFKKDDVEKKIATLSGGEVARLAFARLGVAEPTVLVLDEPTNHLDLEGIRGLAAGLEKYPNAILFVSHDRWFVNELATRILEITPDGVLDYAGTYQEYLEYREKHPQIA